MERPCVVIVDSNTFAGLGLKNMLQNVMPIMDVDNFRSFAELEANRPEHYFHYFVNINVVLEHKDFFVRHKKKIIVLSHFSEPSVLAEGFHNICVSLSENHLLKSLLMLEHYAHANGRNLPGTDDGVRQSVLSAREVEVMSLIVKGYINKEIADKLGIGISTVITHRKNLMAKLKLRSVASLTAYAVMNGFVDINSI